MELTFNKTGELYVAEFKADKEFSLHIERMNGLGSIKMQQNGAEGGKYADVEDFDTRNNTKPVIEYDSGAFVAPKWIRIESSVLPTYAAITTDGDVVEIKSQAKSIEISSNGTTSVEPDAGFSYLSKVDVKVDVPTSGEGGESSGGEEKIRYCKVLSIFGIEILMYTAAIVKCAADGTTKFYPNVYEHIADYDILAAGIIISDSYESVKLLGMGFEEAYANMVNDGLLQTITEEEFYNLNA